MFEIVHRLYLVSVPPLRHLCLNDIVAVLFIDGKPTEVYSSRESHNAYFVNQNKQFNLKEYIKVNNE